MWVSRGVLCLSEQTSCSDHEETDGSYAISHKTASHQLHMNKLFFNQMFLLFYTYLLFHCFTFIAYDIKNNINNFKTSL